MSVSLFNFCLGLVNFDLKRNTVIPVGESLALFAEWWDTRGNAACLFCMAILSAVAILAISPKSNRLYWLHSLVLVIFKAFTGGSLAAMFVGKLPVLITDDFVILFSIIAWYLVHYTSISDLVLFKPVRLLWTVLAQIFRTSAICNATKFACATIKTTRSFYGIPFFGPIIVGTTVAAIGPFIPLDGGLQCISKEVPPVIQGALFSSAFFHFMVNDRDGVVGVFIRSMLGDWGERVVKGVLALLWMIDAVGEMLEWESCRPFSIIFSGIGASLGLPEMRQYFVSVVELMRVRCPCPGCPCSDSTAVTLSDDQLSVSVSVSDSVSKTKSIGSYIYWMSVLYARFMFVIAVAIAAHGHVHSGR